MSLSTIPFPRRSIFARTLVFAAIGAIGLAGFSAPAQAGAGGLGVKNAAERAAERSKEQARKRAKKSVQKNSKRNAQRKVRERSLRHAEPPRRGRDHFGDRSLGRHAACEAGARRLTGRVIRSTIERATHRRLDRACDIALRECRDSLNHLRRSGRKLAPFARCKVLKRQHAVAAPAEYRCVAKAFTRRGNPLSDTHAVRVRGNEHRACTSALRRCERRLEAKRWNEGRRYPHARCEVTRSQEIASHAGGYRDGYRPIDLRY